MRQITEYDSRPKDVEVYRTGTKAYIRIRDNIEETETGYRATEYETEIVYSEGLEDRIETEKSKWISFVKTEVYEDTARKVRAHRKELIEATDNYCLTDRPQPSAEMLAYRQHLRDIPEQEGFPYDIDWGTKPEQ